MLTAFAALVKLIARVFALGRMANKDRDDWRACGSTQVAKRGGSLFFGPGKQVLVRQGAASPNPTREGLAQS